MYATDCRIAVLAMARIGIDVVFERAKAFAAPKWLIANWEGAESVRAARIQTTGGAAILSAANP